MLRYKTRIDDINDERSADHADQKTVNPEEKESGDHKRKTDDTLDKSPFKENLTLADSRYGVIVDVLQTDEETGEAEHLEVRHTLQPAVRVEKDEDRLSKQNQDRHRRIDNESSATDELLQNLDDHRIVVLHLRKDRVRDLVQDVRDEFRRNLLSALSLREIAKSRGIIEFSDKKPLDIVAESVDEIREKNEPAETEKLLERLSGEDQERTPAACDPIE